MTPTLELPASVQNRACFQQFMGGLAVDPMAFEQIASQIRAVGMDAVWKANEEAKPGMFSQSIYLLAASMRLSGMEAEFPGKPAGTSGASASTPVVDEAGTPPYVISRGTAIIPVNGPLSKQASSLQGMFGGSSTVGMRKALSLALADAQVERIMFHIDSPGGTVAGTGDLGDDIFAASSRKPIASYIEDMGTSAAYWLASQASEVYASQYAHIGSIGVIWTVYDRSAQAEKMGVKVHAITSSPGKAFAVDGMKITDKQLAKMQAFVDQMYGQFVGAVARGRGVDIESARAMSGDADIYGAEQALELGLVDSITSFGHALADFASAGKKRDRDDDDDMRRMKRRKRMPGYTANASSALVALDSTSGGTASGLVSVTEAVAETEEDAPSNTQPDIVQPEESPVTPDPAKPAANQVAAPVTLSNEEHQALVRKADAGVEAKQMIQALLEKQAQQEAAVLASERERVCAEFPIVSKESAAACKDLPSLRAVEATARAASAAGRSPADPKQGPKSEPSPEETAAAEIKEWQAAHDARVKAAFGEVA